MTIKIIHRGVKPDELPIQVSCRSCSTLFEFHQTDARVVFDQRDGDYYSIACPVCSATCTKARWG